MNWTEKEEKRWATLTKQREENKKEVTKSAFVECLRELADRVESGEETIHRDDGINIKYIRPGVHYGWEGTPPIIGRRVTVYLVGEKEGDEDK